MSWKRGIAWGAAIVAALIVVVIVVGLLLLSNHSVQRDILARVLRSESQSTGTHISVRNSHLQLSKLSLALDGVTVRGTEPADAPPLLTADHLDLQLKIVSLLRRTYHVQQLIIDHPVLHVLVNAQGISNIPQQQPSNGSSTNLWDLAIQRFRLDNGEIYHNNQKSILDAELHDLLLKAAYDNAKDSYKGTLSYDRGLVHFGNYNPLPHALRADFTAGLQGMNINPLVLSSGQSQVRADVALQNYSSPVIKASYDATLVTAEFREILKNPAVPVGTLRLAGAMDYQSAANIPFLDGVKLQGNLTSPALLVQTPNLRTDVRDIGAQYSLENGEFRAQNLRARLLGGDFQGELLVKNVSTPNSQAHLTAMLRGVSLAAAQAAVPSLRNSHVTGTMNGDADATWKGSLQDLVARSNLDVHGAVAPAKSGAPAIPLNAALHARYIGNTGEITLTESLVRTPKTSIVLNGTVSNLSALAVRVNSSGLHEIEVLASDFNIPSSGQPLGLSGTGSFTGTVTGSEKNPRLAGQLLARNFMVKGSSWRLLRTNVNLSPSSASLSNGELDAQPQGRVAFDLDIGLRHWSYSKASPISARVTASQMRVSDLEHLAGSTYPVSGMLAANLNVKGSVENPTGNGTVALTNANVSGQLIQSVNMRFHGNGTAVDADLKATLPAGTANATLTYFPKTEGYEGRLTASNIQLAKLTADQVKKLGVNGVLNLSASGRGTIRNPQLQLTATIPQLTVHGQNISNLNLQGDVAHEVATLALSSNVAQTYVRAHGTVGITSPYNADIAIDTAGIPVQTLVAMYSPAQAANLSGQTELHAWVRGPLKDRQKLEAHVTIPTLNVNYKAIQLAAAKPVTVDYRAGVATLQPGEIRGTGTDLRFQGVIPVNSNAPASLTLLGNVDLRIVQLVQPDIDTSGQVQFDINSHGTVSNPDIVGQIRLVNVTALPSGMPLGLEGGNGVLTLRNNRLEVTKFNGTVGGGPVTAQGAVTFRPAIQFNVAMAATGIRFQYPQGLRVAVDSNLTLSGTPQNSWLRGQVRVDRLYLMPDFDLTSFMTQFGGEAPPPPEQGFMSNLHLAVAVVSSSELNLASSQLSIQGSANLQLTGTAADPVVLGRTTLSGGDVFFNGTRYVIQNGTISFNNPVLTEPVVNLRMTTVVQQYNIALNVSGPMDRLRTNFTSDPALPPADIINLLATGKTTEAAAANPVPVGTMAAQAVVAQGLGEVTSRIQKVAGISHFSLDPNIGATPGAQQGPRLEVQQRVTGNLYVTFATDITSTQDQEVMIQYQYTPRISFTGLRDQNGGFAFDARIHKTF